MMMISRWWIQKTYVRARAHTHTHTTDRQTDRQRDIVDDLRRQLFVVPVLLEDDEEGGRIRGG